jgi:hypothetical protein
MVSIQALTDDAKCFETVRATRPVGPGFQRSAGRDDDRRTARR